MTYQYRPIAEAYGQAEERLADTRLQESIDDYLGGVWPPGLEQTAIPVAVFAPYLGRAANSEMSFQKKIIGSGFVPLVATYQDTAFVTANPDVVACYKPPLILPQGQRRRGWVVDPEDRAGNLAPTKTVYGRDIVDYWRDVRAVVYAEKGVPIGATVDFSGWYAYQAKRFGWKPRDRNKAPFYYMALMALYASGRAVLYDSPPTEFFGRVMQPAIDETRENLRVEPLIICGPENPTPDWVDLSFLDQPQVDRLVEKGEIGFECTKDN